MDYQNGHMTDEAVRSAILATAWLLAIGCRVTYPLLNAVLSMRLYMYIYSL